MADDQERLVLQMSADLRSFEKEMARTRTITERRLREAEQAALKADRNLSRAMSQVGRNMVASLKSSLADIAPTVAAAFTVQQVTAYADAWTNGRNALAAAGVATSDLAARQSELVDLANETRTSTETIIGLYRRLTIANEELGLSQSDVLRLTELVNKSFITSGASTQEAASAALQLSQALASGVLQGDELRSLRENAPQLAQAIAKAMGVSIGALKELGAEGKITAEVVAQAILGAGDTIETKFNATTATIGQALQVLDNELGRYIGQSDASAAASERVAQAIISLANNLDHILPVAATLATVIGVAYAGSLAVAGVRTAAATVETVRYQAALIALQARATGATSAQVALNAAIAANPVGIAVVAAGALAAGLLILNQRITDADLNTREYKQASDALTGSTDAYTAASQAAATATGEQAQAARDAAAAARQEAIQNRDAAAAKLASAKASLALAQAQYTQVRQSGAGGVGYQPGASGAGIFQAILGNREVTAQRNVDGLVKAIEQADAAIANADSILNAKAPRVPSVTADPSGRRSRASSGPSEAELAAQRDMLRLQGQIEVLRAQGRTADADAAERHLDILNLTKQYEDAGFQNAQAMAELQVNSIAQAEAAARGRATAEEFVKDILDQANEALARHNEELVERLRHEADLARLAGDPARIQTAERALYIAEETNRILAARKGLISESDARNEASGKADQLRAADIIGGLIGNVDPVEQAAAAYAKIDALRQQDLLSEQQAAQAKAQVNADYHEQRLSNASQFFGTLAGLTESNNKTLAALGKAAAITQATIDGYVAVQKALASAPPPFNYALAAAVGVVAAANVAKIAGFERGGYTGNGGTKQVAGVVHGGEFVMNAQTVKRLGVANLEAIQSGRLLTAPDPSRLGGGSSSSSYSYSPTIDARGADLAAVERLERVLADDRRSFAERVNGVRDRRHKYKLGSRG